MTKDEKKEAIVEYFADVPIYRYAAMWAGIDEDTLALWRKEDSDFSERLHRAKAKWVNSKVKKAKVEFALERMEKEVFGQKVTVEGGENAIKLIIEKYGKTEGVDDVPRVEEIAGGSSKDSA